MIKTRSLDLPIDCFIRSKGADHRIWIGSEFNKNEIYDFSHKRVLRVGFCHQQLYAGQHCGNIQTGFPGSLQRQNWEQVHVCSLFDTCAFVQKYKNKQALEAYTPHYILTSADFSKKGKLSLFQQWTLWLTKKTTKRPMSLNYHQQCCQRAKKMLVCLVGQSLIKRNKQNYL